tara:strand:+ start:355 stop:849 length:495 start_codon:yes stop_codon:yes gene_type:complete
MAEYHLASKEYLDIWHQIFKHYKRDRAYKLLDLQESGPLYQRDSDILTIDVWTTTEFPSSDKETWDQLWTNYRGYYTLPIQRRMINRLFAQPRTIYRGGSKGGRSWTLSRDKAKWFLNHRGYYTKFYDGDDPQPTDLWERKVSKEEVLMIHNGRGEQEVVIDIE